MSRIRLVQAVTLAAMLLVVLTGLFPGQGIQFVVVGSGPPLAATPAPLAEDSPLIHLAYFSKAGCPVCARVDTYLDEIQLYNLAFIVPLVVVFGLAYFGTTSQQLGLFIHRRTAAIKLATAMLFVILVGWLLYGLV